MSVATLLYLTSRIRHPMCRREDRTMRHEGLDKVTSHNHVIRQIAAAVVILWTMAVGCSYAGTLSQWERLARQGDARAETQLGIAYYYGQGVPQNYVRAAYWFEKAADQGDAEAEFGLGIDYFVGQGVPENLATSAFWYRKAADQGYAMAEQNLGNAYSSGKGVPQDDALAVYWWGKAAVQGYAPAEENFANSYATGRGVTKNLATALTWWAKVAAQGGSLGKIAQQNIDVYYYRQDEKQFDAQQAAKDAKWAKINGHVCEIEFTVSNNSRYPIVVGSAWPKQGGIFICDKANYCGTNLLIGPAAPDGLATFEYLSPNYHESFKANPYYIFGEGTDLRYYYVKILLQITNFPTVKVYRFTSPWYSTCERPTFNFSPSIN